MRYRRIVVTIIAGLALLIVTGETTVSLGSSHLRPDLIVRAWRVSFAGCAPGRPVLFTDVSVLNRGTAPSPSVRDRALVQVMDQHGNGWGNGAALPAIPPGGTVSVRIPIYYLMADPWHMGNAAPHPFQAIVDPLGLVDELGETNNRSTVINVTLKGTTPCTR